MPDLEQRFWQKYRDQGLVVVALDSRDTVEQIGEVEQYIGNIGGITYDVGIGGAELYMGLTQNFSGLNPFPVDVIVDKNGMIRYVTREYDADAMTEVVEALLAE